MRTKARTASDIGESLLFYSLHDGEIEQISDDAVNAAYNYFDAERMKYYHNVYVKADRNFRRKKQEKPDEWNNFSSVIRLCKKNNFHLRCYIKYCFINNLVPKAKGKTLSDIVYLRNYPQVIGYAKNKDEIERMYSIYNSINKTIFLVKRLMKSNGMCAKDVIKNIVNSGKLSEYVSTGTVSPYFLSLIRNINVIIHKYADKHSDDRTVLNDLCSRMEKFGNDSMKSMSMFYPSSTSKTIIELCSD